MIPEIIITDRTKTGRILLSRRRGRDIRFVISIGSAERLPAGFWSHPAKKLRLTFADVEHSSDQCHACSWGDIETLVGFCKKIDKKVLIHCEAGISRSPAAALILIAVKLGPGKEPEALEHLLSIEHAILPNRRMIWMADKILNRAGALKAAHEKNWNFLVPNGLEIETPRPTPGS